MIVILNSHNLLRYKNVKVQLINSHNFFRYKNIEVQLINFNLKTNLVQDQVVLIQIINFLFYLQHQHNKTFYLQHQHNKTKTVNNEISHNKYNHNC